MKQYSRVSYEQRCQIQALLERKISIPKIATQLGFHKSTIYREIKRNSTRPKNSTRPFRYEYLEAHIEAAKRFKACRRKLCIKGELEQLIERHLQRFWSPELIAGRIKEELKIKISHQSIYRWIEKRSNLKAFLHYKGKRRFSYKRAKHKARPEWALDIKDRPDVINERKRIGDWERDLMFGANKQGVLVCTDRKSRYSKVSLVSSQSLYEVSRLTEELIQSTGKPAKSVTNDNGIEFKGKGVLNCPVYFCRPQSPQERGTVENTIWRMRKFFKKGEEITRDQLAIVEEWLNFRPMKVLDYKTPHEVYYGTKVALAT